MSARGRRKRSRAGDTAAELEQLEYDAALLEDHVHQKTLELQQLTSELQQLKDRIDFLRSPEEHIQPTKKGRKQCKVEGCTKWIQKRGLCHEHGGVNSTRVRKPCSVEGCTTRAVKGGLCIAHGGQVAKCTVEGCTNNALVGGLCCKHGAKVRKCSVEGCETLARKGGVCMKHGSKCKKLCNFEGCSTPVQRAGFCSIHAVRRTCKHPGCSNQVKARGKCRRHDRKDGNNDNAEMLCLPTNNDFPDVCWFEGCTYPSESRGFCSTHSLTVCSHSGCKSLIIGCGKCPKHTTKGQTNQKAGGEKHGARTSDSTLQNSSEEAEGQKELTCCIKECTTPAGTSGLCPTHSLNVSHLAANTLPV